MPRNRAYREGEDARVSGPGMRLLRRSGRQAHRRRMTAPQISEHRASATVPCGPRRRRRQGSVLFHIHRTALQAPLGGLPQTPRRATRRNARRASAGSSRGSSGHSHSRGKSAPRWSPLSSSIAIPQEFDSMGGFRPVQCRNAGRPRRLAAHPIPERRNHEKEASNRGACKNAHSRHGAMASPAYTRRASTVAPGKSAWTARR